MSGSTTRVMSMAAVALVATAWTAHAAPSLRIQNVSGHISFGYAKLFLKDAPGGSLSATGGLDYPITRTIRAGVGLGFHLLGSRIVEREKILANVDYTAFEAVALVHWLPDRLGPVARISAGPALLSPRAEVSSSGSSTLFSDLPVESVSGGFAVDVTLMSRTPAPVRIGVELGTRVVVREPENWTIASARVTFHY